jgi:Coenzyme PQQ synthesis protein D (PqqD)
MPAEGEAMRLRLDTRTVIRPNPRSTFRELTEGSGGVLLHLDTAAYHGLNEVGVAIWSSIGSGITYGELLVRLRTQIPDAPDSLDDDVGTFLDELYQRDLILIEPPA